MAGFVLAAPMAAIMSTISSFVLISSSAVVRDLYQRNVRRPLTESQMRRTTHLATLTIAAAALAFALRPPEFLQFIVVFSGTGLAGTFLIPTILAVYWPRMNREVCLAGMLGGFLSFLAQYAAFGTKSFGGFDPYRVVVAGVIVLLRRRRAAMASSQRSAQAELLRGRVTRG